MRMGFIPYGPTAPDPDAALLWGDTSGVDPVVRKWDDGTSQWVEVGASSGGLIDLSTVEGVVGDYVIPANQIGYLMDGEGKTFLVGDDFSTVDQLIAEDPQGSLILSAGVAAARVAEALAADTSIVRRLTTLHNPVPLVVAQADLVAILTNLSLGDPWVTIDSSGLQTFIRVGTVDGVGDGGDPAAVIRLEGVNDTSPSLVKIFGDLQVDGEFHPASLDAGEVAYDNSGSDLVATTVKDALDELAARVAALEP